MKGATIQYETVRRVTLRVVRSDEDKNRVLDWVHKNGYRVQYAGPCRPFARNRYMVRAEKVVKG